MLGIREKSNTDKKCLGRSFGRGHLNNRSRPPRYGMNRHTQVGYSAKYHRFARSFFWNQAGPLLETNAPATLNESCRLHRTSRHVLPEDIGKEPVRILLDVLRQEVVSKPRMHAVP